MGFLGFNSYILWLRVSLPLLVFLPRRLVCSLLLFHFLIYSLVTRYFCDPHNSKESSSIYSLPFSSFYTMCHSLDCNFPKCNYSLTYNVNNFILTLLKITLFTNEIYDYFARLPLKLTAHILNAMGKWRECTLYSMEHIETYTGPNSNHCRNETHIHKEGNSFCL